MTSSAPLDLVLVNGRLVLPETGEIEATAGVADGRVAALVTGESTPAVARDAELLGAPGMGRYLAR